MVFGSRQPPPLHWKLGSDTIEVVEHLHLGILHSAKSTIARTILQTSRGRSSFFLLSTALVPGLAALIHSQP